MGHAQIPRSRERTNLPHKIFILLAPVEKRVNQRWLITVKSTLTDNPQKSDHFVNYVAVSVEFGFEIEAALPCIVCMLGANPVTSHESHATLAHIRSHWWSEPQPRSIENPQEFISSFRPFMDSATVVIPGWCIKMKERVFKPSCHCMCVRSFKPIPKLLWVQWLQTNAGALTCLIFLIYTFCYMFIICIPPNCSKNIHAVL